MKETLKNLGRRVIPKTLFRWAQPYYHGIMAVMANYYYGRPSQRLFVIGVTGTAGKSTVINLLAKILNHAGHRTGLITTANAFDGKVATINQHGLSMPGGPMLQQQLQRMVHNGCRYAIVEATSEGLAQNRHLGINFQMALLTSLAPAHIDAHGSFANYRAAKMKLFQAASKNSKSFLGVNVDTEDADRFLVFPSYHKFAVTLHNNHPEQVQVYEPQNITTEPHINFTLNDVKFTLNLIGEFNVYNTALAVASANMLGVDLQDCAAALKGFTGVTGRMQTIANNRNLQIFVDYAPEPSGMLNSLQALSRLPHRQLIHVFGSTGGHRDVSKRFEFGQISAQFADTIIITNDDVYDSDPELIAKNIEQGIEQAPVKKVTSVKTVLDRRQAIKEALHLAQANDIVLITGKGSEQFLVLPGNERIPWDEPSVVEQELQKL